MIIWFEKMKLFSVLSLAVAVMAQYELTYDDLGNKKVAVDKGPRFCGGKSQQVVDRTDITFKCKSRNGKAKAGFEIFYRFKNILFEPSKSISCIKIIILV